MSISRKKIVMILIMLFLLLASIFGTAYIDREIGRASCRERV